MLLVIFSSGAKAEATREKVRKLKRYNSNTIRMTLEAKGKRKESMEHMNRMKIVNLNEIQNI